MSDIAIKKSDVHAGQARYTKSMLSVYDFMVLEVNCRFAWRCPKDEILRRYQAAVGRRHLEIGVGTAYFPDQVTFPGPAPEVTLFDMNENTLAFGARRLARMRPATVQGNALEPLTGVPDQHFDSVAVNLVLHCIPGDIATKGQAILANAAKATRPGGKIFGSTVLAHGVPVGRFGHTMMRKLNAKGIMHNTEDSLSDLAAVLAKNFEHFALSVRGCVGLFTATAP